MGSKILLLLLLSIFTYFFTFFFTTSKDPLNFDLTTEYWLKLNRISKMEYLYLGVPGKIDQSILVNQFKVKTGIPNQRPTPLPFLVNREYWLIIDKKISKNNPETSPYFLTLDIPGIDTEPFGPTPYLECNGQCNWILPGAFGLHGINGDLSRISEENLGSSGCVRHADFDITYLYNILEPNKNPVRYYISDI